jgi:hypothetical protein
MECITTPGECCRGKDGQGENTKIQDDMADIMIYFGKACRIQSPDWSELPCAMQSDGRLQVETY